MPETHGNQDDNAGGASGPLSPSKSQLRLTYWSPILAAAVAYLSALTCGFTLDDFHIILENPDVIGGFGLLDVTERMGNTYYRPVSVFTFWLDYRMFGEWAAGYHVTSVLLHLLATGLVVHLFRRLTNHNVALLGGLLFAVHPIHVEVVTAIANRTELLATIFVLAVLLVHTRPGRGGWLRLVAENGLAFLGLLAKESALTLPALLLIVGWFGPQRRLRPSSLLRVVPAIIAYLVIKGQVIGVLGFEGSTAFFNGATLTERVLTVLSIMWRYTENLFVPTSLSASYYTSWIAAPLHPQVILGAAVVIAVAAVLVSAIWRPSTVALGLGLMVAAMAPYLHLQNMMINMADRFLYLPSVGLCLVGGYLLSRAEPRFASKTMFRVLIVSIVLSSGFLTGLRSLDWRDTLTLWTAAVEESPESHFARGNMALAAFHAGRPDIAIHELEAALELAPGHVAYTTTLAEIFHRGGDHIAELEVLQRAQQVGQNDPAVVEAIGRVLLEQAN